MSHLHCPKCGGSNVFQQPADSLTEATAMETKKYQMMFIISLVSDVAIFLPIMVYLHMTGTLAAVVLLVVILALTVNGVVLYWLWQRKRRTMYAYRCESCGNTFRAS